MTSFSFVVESARVPRNLPRASTAGKKANCGPPGICRSPTCDERIPKPPHITVNSHRLHSSFPAEHPKFSHTCCFSIFPSLDSADDPKRGVEGRESEPISSETPGNNYDTIVISKTQGSGQRHEIQSAPSASERKGLYWLDNDGFLQFPKPYDVEHRYYPAPIKTMAPNLERKDPKSKLSARTVNALRNLQRHQLLTSHQMEFTGMGPSNPVKIDNYDDKSRKLMMTGIEDDSMYPSFDNTFDPARKIQGNTFLQNFKYPSSLPTQPYNATGKSTDYPRMLTLTEKEQRRLFFGTTHANHPEDKPYLWDSATRLKLYHWQPEIEYVPEVPYKPKIILDNETIRREGKKEKWLEIQQMSAKNRWQLLESQKPHHDITSLNIKYKSVENREHPKVFYPHEESYNEARGGLYQTSHKPEKLNYTLNTLKQSGPEAINTIYYHVDAADLPSVLSEGVKQMARYSRTARNSQPFLSGGRPWAKDIYRNHDIIQNNLQNNLTPDAEHARGKVQDEPFLSTDSEYADNYNVCKFMQNNTIRNSMRKEPNVLMSHENQDLNSVRVQLQTKGEKHILVDPPIKEIEENFTGDAITTQYLSSQAQWKQENDYEGDSGSQWKEKQPRECSDQVKNTKKYGCGSVNKKNHCSSSSQGKHKPQDCHCLSGQSSHAGICANQGSLNNTCLCLQNECAPKFPQNKESQIDIISGTPFYNLRSKDSCPRFNWVKSLGIPRPQTSLPYMQINYSKSDAYHRFHKAFKENAPDLRENLHEGRKHIFYGSHSAIMQG